MDWQTMLQQAMAAPRVCHEIVCMLARAGFNVTVAEAVPAALALLLQAKETSDALCNKFLAEVHQSKAAVSALVAWLPRATCIRVFGVCLQIY